MAIDKATFETLAPSRFITFTFPSPLQPHHHCLRVAVLDSPLPLAHPPRVAAMLVPDHRESDWIFATESGHLHLLLHSPNISRLVLVGAVPSTAYSPASYHRPAGSSDHRHLHRSKLEESLTPLLICLCPKSLLACGVPEIPFLVYEDNVIGSVLVDRCVGPYVGEMLVEDVEIECSGSGREFRRRLRFKRMPNFVQTEIRIVSDSNLGLELESVVGEGLFRIDVEALVHPYLAPMVASLALLGAYIEKCVQSGARPRALCLGIGGGALPAFLKSQLGFEVVGVEEDEVVLRIARQHFGLKDDKFIPVFVGDGIEFLEKLTGQATRYVGHCCASEDEEACSYDVAVDLDAKYDVIMVDLDSSDAKAGISAPPVEFIKKSVLTAAKMALHEFGILVLNVIPPTKSFYDILVCEFRVVFKELYEIDVGNQENFVLIATSSAIEKFDTESNNFLTKLNLVISSKYLDSIRKV